MISRRMFLTGAVVAASTTFTGCGAIRHAYERARQGCPSAVPAPSPVAELRRTSSKHHSAYVSAPVGVVALIQGNVERLAFALPGRGGIADDLAHQLEPFLRAIRFDGALICLDGGESYWHPRAHGENRLAMLLEEIVPSFQRAFPQARSASIGGWSMGGFGALVAAESRPDLFSHAMGVSPALWQRYGDAVDDAFDSAEDFKRYSPFSHIERLRGSSIRITCGTHDPFYSAARAFADQLRGHVRHLEVTYPQHGCHDDDSWSTTALDDLRFLLG